ncbi:MAG: hypothetical protein M0R03_12390 [Novosphingobium sp.]|nr:hypothetical protein [Novosphingobium sp.]
MNTRPYRVVQWATGKLGAESLRRIIDHPGLELAGVYVYSDAKAGKDAGELCGRPPTGILATNDIEAICASDADAVFHMPTLEPTPDNSDREVIRLLEAGKHVISIRGYFYPGWRDPARGRRLEAAARKGGAVLFGTGIIPGFIFDRVGPMLTGFCTNVRGIHLNEYFDLRMRPWRTVHDVCGLGHKPGVITPAHGACVALTELYAEMFHRIAAMMETACGDVKLDVEVITTDADIVIRTGTIPAGTGKATIWHWSATLANGLELHLRSHWHVGDVEGWDERNVWIVEVDGEPRFRAEMVLEHSGPDGLSERGYDPNGRALAATCVNALPEVMAAAPGILIPPSFAHFRQPLARAD